MVDEVREPVGDEPVRLGERVGRGRFRREISQRVGDRLVDGGRYLGSVASGRNLSR
ncbi:hypothetical protein [Nocardia farcinica]|uniref:hypothetical protein n=1 Tax=Nocardia farcinica TaxID=37329 RepID=UPI001E4A0301|nr:hypothetical protein [Nocardia farcinica]MBF6067511.1 hypothetical protein [Nocardia farcinica]